MTTTERIDALFKNSGKSNRSILLELGFSPTALAEWNRGKSKPTVEAITSLAKYFNVSADYLLCLSDEATPLKTADIIGRPDFAISTELAELSKDKDFVNSAKLYKAVDNGCKKEICAYILGVATALGVNIAQILGK